MNDIFFQDENDRVGHTAILNLRELRMQSFMYRAANTWGPPYQCSLTGNFHHLTGQSMDTHIHNSTFTGTYRDESAPLFVGTTLALASLGAVGAYGVWR